jgi:tetratricopeptide (TPR) repeat protein
MAMTYQFAGDNERAYQQFEHTIAMDPSFPLAHEYFSGLLLEMGRFEQAIQEHQKSQLLSGASPEKAAAEAAAQLKAYKSGGPAGFWRHTLDVYLRQHVGSVWAGGMASAYALVGDKDKAFEWLDKAYEEHEGGDITLLKTEFTWKNLHGDPRFSALLRRMGLPEEEVQPVRAKN